MQNFPLLKRYFCIDQCFIESRKFLIRQTFLTQQDLNMKIRFARLQFKSVLIFRIDGIHKLRKYLLDTAKYFSQLNGMKCNFYNLQIYMVKSYKNVLLPVSILKIKLIYGAHQFINLNIAELIQFFERYIFADQ